VFKKQTICYFLLYVFFSDLGTSISQSVRQITVQQFTAVTYETPTP